MPWSRFRKKRNMPEGLWVKCPSCGETLFKKDLEENLGVCSGCDHHFHMTGAQRAMSLVDSGSFTELWADLHPVDRLQFVDKEPYPNKLAKARARAGANEAAVAGTGCLDGKPISLCALDFSFMGGSMGAVVGEKVTRTIELATAERLPAVVVSCSGGARMHEGVLSLMQMGKTSAAIARHHAQGGLFISVLANPTTGGVMASFAALGDLIFAEPNALIGFAGPRVIQETLRTELPEGFQRAEFLLKRGFIDRIVERKALRDELRRSIGFLWEYTDEQIEKYRPALPEASEEASDEAEDTDSSSSEAGAENAALKG